MPRGPTQSPSVTRTARRTGNGGGSILYRDWALTRLHQKCTANICAVWGVNMLHKISVTMGTGKWFTAAVPSLFGSRDQFCGRQSSHRPGWGMVWGWLNCLTVKLTSCCGAWSLTGPDRSTALRLGTPGLGETKTKVKIIADTCWWTSGYTRHYFVYLAYI